MGIRSYIIANIKSGNEYFDTLDDYSFACKNLYNSTLYEYRQMFFHGEGMVSDYQMFDIMSEYNSPIPAKVKQQTISLVYQNIKSFYSLIEKKQNAKLPKYMNSKTGRANIILTNQAILKLKFVKENKIAFNYNDETIEFNVTNLKHKLNLTFGEIKQIRIVYRKSLKSYQVILIVKSNKQKILKRNRVMAIDLGLDRIMSIVFGKYKVLFDGKQLKKINYRFNKNLAKLQSEKDKLENELKKTHRKLDEMDYDAVFYYELSMEFDFNEKKYKKLIRKQTHDTNRLKNLEKIMARTYENRNNRLKYCLHWLSRELIKLCVSNGISTIVIGYNKEWKQGINLGKRTNQNFVQIPHGTLIEYITYKADEYGISVQLQEESYTSKCSFIDNEPIQKASSYVGKRIKRGLFRSKYGKEIHADINAAYNIAKKAGYNFKCLYSKRLCSWAVVKRISFN